MVIFDTDILIDFFKGVERAAELLDSVPKYNRYTTAITIMEIFKGAKDKRELILFDKFFQKNFADILYPNVESSKMAVRLVKKYTLSHGLRLADAMISSLSSLNRAELVTGNKRHFEFIKNIRITVPTYKYRE